MRKCVYMPIFGDYEELRDPEVITDGWDYICITDNDKIKSNIWKIRNVDNFGLHPRKISRRVTALNHEYVGDYDLSIAIGGNIQPKYDLNKFLSENIPNDESIDLAIGAHYGRNCLYKEAEACISRKKDKIGLIKKQISRYKDEGYPQNNGLFACGIIIRKHNRPNLEKHCKLWWHETKNNCVRDQLSFPYILWKHKLINLFIIKHNMFYPKNGKYFRRHNHGPINECNCCK